MSVLINFKICDNTPECSGIAVCPTGALSYDEAKKTINIDNTKCISCGQCMPQCPVSAICVAKTDEEYKDYEKQIENDPRTIKDLFVDRYGASAISDFFVIEESQLQNKIEYEGITLIEIYEASNTQCLLKSIPLRDITDEMNGDIRYYKLNSSETLVEKFQLSVLPSLLIFKTGALLGKIDGYYMQDQKEEFLSQVKSIIA